MHKYLLVGAGGFAGAIARYWVGTMVTQRMGLRFPFGTFLINVSGCFLIGFFMHLLAERGVLQRAGWVFYGLGGRASGEGCAVVCGWSWLLR